MSVTMSVKQFIAQKQDGQPFATRELLQFGLRGTIDQILHLLVKRGDLVRLARGVFCKLGLRTALPSLREIALTKARAFGKTIVAHGIDALKMLNMATDGCEETTFAVSGKTSSFQALNVRIHFKGSVHTRIQAGDSKAGLAIRALAQLGKEVCSLDHVYQACFEFDRNDRRQMKKEFPCKMPGWMSDLVLHEGKRVLRLTIPKPVMHWDLAYLEWLDRMEMSSWQYPS